MRSPGVQMSGVDAVREVLAAADLLRPFVLRVAYGDRHLTETQLMSWGSQAGRFVQVVVDPALEIGQAVWMDPFPLPCPTLVVLGGSQEEIEAWAGSRGLCTTAARAHGGREYPEVFGVWEQHRFGRVGWMADAGGVGLVELSGWAQVAGSWGSPEEISSLRHRVGVNLPADWVPKSEHAMRMDLALLTNKQISENAAWRQMVSDLDRCPHWRHEGDTCSGWRGPGTYDGGCRGGVSLGNPLLPLGRVLGVTVRGTMIVQPGDRADRHDPAKWLVARREGQELNLPATAVDGDQLAAIINREIAGYSLGHDPNDFPAIGEAIAKSIRDEWGG